MRVTKGLKIPVHYVVTKAKLDKLDKLTSGILQRPATNAAQDLSKENGLAICPISYVMTAV